MSAPPIPADDALRWDGGMISSGFPPTDKQIAYVEALRAKLHLPTRMLDDECQRRFRCPFAQMDRRQMSTLIDTMIGWTENDADLRRAMGQVDMPGFG